MVNTFIKQTKQTAADQAKKIAQQVAREPYEMVKTVVPAHIIEGAKKDNSSLVSEMIDAGSSQPEQKIDEEAIKIKTNKRLEELEDEIRRIRDERKRKEEEWRKAQEALMQPEQSKQEQYVEPQGKRRRGFMGGIGKKKQGTKEMGKQMSG